MADLNPCPFCGHDGDWLQVRPTQFRTFQGCCDCGASAPPRRTRDEAVAAWNRRAAPPSPGEGRPPATDPTLPWRKLLWLRHGCPIETLYGDDGEMQCSTCALDFRRMPADEVELRWRERGLAKLVASPGEDREPGGSDG